MAVEPDCRRQVTRVDGLKSDLWVEVARRVLAGDYRDADDSTIKSLVIGLRSNPHADCQSALRVLRG